MEEKPDHAEIKMIDCEADFDIWNLAHFIFKYKRFDWLSDGGRAIYAMLSNHIVNSL